MPNDSDSISTEPSWIHSPISPIPLVERAAAKKAAADASLRQASHLKFHECFNRAILKVYAKPKVDLGLNREDLATFLRSLRRSGKRQTAHNLLARIRDIGRIGRPKADVEHYELAEKIHAEECKLHKERCGGPVLKKEVLYHVKKSTGKSGTTLRRAYAKYGHGVEACREAMTSLEEMPIN